MTLDLTVYCRDISDDTFRHAALRLNEFGMTAEPDPGFALASEYLTFRFQITDPRFEALKDSPLKTELEVYVSDFDLETEKQKLNPKPDFLARIFGAKQREIAYGTPETDRKLACCRKEVLFIWREADMFQYRFCLLMSALLTAETGGLCNHSDTGLWYEDHVAVSEAWKKVQQYEESLEQRDVPVLLFDGWED